MLHNVTVWMTIVNLISLNLVTPCMAGEGIPASKGKHAKPGDESTATRPRLEVSLGHTAAAVNAVAISPDGKLALTGGGDGTACLWHIPTRSEIGRFHSPAGGVFYVAFSHNSKYAFTGSSDGNGILWNIQTRKEVRRFSGYFDFDDHLGSKGGFAFSLDGTRAYATLENGSRRLWNAQTGVEIPLISKSKGDKESGSGGADFSKNGRYLATCWADGLHLWDAVTGAEIWHRKETGGGLKSIAFSADSTKILVSTFPVSAYDVKTGTKVQEYKGDTGLVLSVSYSPDGRFVLAGSWGYHTTPPPVARIWGAMTGKLLETLLHEDNITGVAFAPDSQSFLTGCKEGSIRLWNTATRKVMARFEGGYGNRVQSLGFGPQGPYIVSDSSDNVVFLWDGATRTRMKRFIGHSNQVTCAVLSPDWQTLTTGSEDFTASLWDVSTETERYRFAPHEQYVLDPHYTADNRIVATAGGRAYLWDTFTGELIRRLGVRDITEGVFREALSPDGKWMITSPILGLSSNDRAKIWDVIQEKQIGLLPGKTVEVKFSPDGKYALALAEKGEELQLFQTSDFAQPGQITPRGKIAVPKQVLLYATFSDDGTTIITTDSGKYVRLWNVPACQQSAEVQLDVDTRLCALSPDKKFLLTAGTYDNIVRIWNATNGQLLCRVITLRDGTWVVTDDVGRFDTNNIEGIRGLHWIIPGDPFNPLPLEIFTQQYFVPNLLARHMTNLSQVDRRQPEVQITNIEAVANDPAVVRVTVLAKPPMPTSDSVTTASHKAVEGIYNLRLFRNGLMVSYLPETSGRVLPNLNGGQVQHTFMVRMPQTPETTKVEFTAYAFNADQVKSPTAHREYSPKAPQTKGSRSRIYLLSIGIDKYEDSHWNLKYAVNDARILQSTLSKLIAATGKEIISVLLASDSDNNQALRGKKGDPSPTSRIVIEAALKRLAGRPAENAAAERVLDSLPSGKALRRSGPDDLVILSFSGHGATSLEGVFYFCPSDIGPRQDKGLTEDLKRHCMSSDTLSTLLRDVDASEMVLIVDACHSGALGGGEDFKPGPLDSKGLAQLAFDKRMRILAASQANGIALESHLIQQGLLMYALIHDGIECRQADALPHDGRIDLSKWLRYASIRVPQLYTELAAGQVQSFGSNDRARGIDIGDPSEEQQPFRQQPLYLDFGSTQARPPIFLIGKDSGYASTDRTLLPYHPNEETPGTVAAKWNAILKLQGNSALIIKALIQFLDQQPAGLYSSYAHAYLIRELLKSNVSSGELMSATRAGLACIRDYGESVHVLRDRMSYSFLVADALLKRGELLEDALWLARIAGSISDRFESDELHQRMTILQQDATAAVAWDAYKYQGAAPDFVNAPGAKPLLSFTGKAKVLLFLDKDAYAYQDILEKTLQITHKYLKDITIPIQAVFASGTDEKAANLVIKDLDTATNTDAKRAFGIDQLPTILVLDSSGKVRYRFSGFMPETPEIIALEVESLVNPIWRREKGGAASSQKK